MIKPYKYYIAIIMIIYTPVASILIGLITILLHNYYDNMVGKIIIYFTGISAISRILTLLNMFFKSKIKFSQIKPMLKQDKIQSVLHQPQHFFNK